MNCSKCGAPLTFHLTLSSSQFFKTCSILWFMFGLYCVLLFWFHVYSFHTFWPSGDSINFFEISLVVVKLPKKGFKGSLLSISLHIFKTCAECHRPQTPSPWKGQKKPAGRSWWRPVINRGDSGGSDIGFTPGDNSIWSVCVCFNLSKVCV